MANLVPIGDLSRIAIWEGVRARRIEGDRLTLAIIEFEGGAVVPEHAHPNEQNGFVLAGEVTIRVGDEERTLPAGGSWCIRANVPHAVVAGSEGAVVVDAFAPRRDDWNSLEVMPPARPRWPSG